MEYVPGDQPVVSRVAVTGSVEESNAPSAAVIAVEVAQFAAPRVTFAPAMLPFPVEASLTVAVIVTGVPMTTVFVAWPFTRTFDTVGGVLSTITVAQLPVVSLFGTESRAYTQIECAPSVRVVVAREPVTTSVALLKAPSWAAIGVAEAQFLAPCVKFAPWIGQSPRPTSLAVAVTVTGGPERVRRFDRPSRAAPVTRGGVLSVVPTVRFTQDSSTKSLGFGSIPGSTPAVGPPVPVTTMPPTGTNRFVTKFEGHVSVNACEALTVSNAASSRTGWNGEDGIAADEVYAPEIRACRGAGEVIGPAPESVNVSDPFTRLYGVASTSNVSRVVRGSSGGLPKLRSRSSSDWLNVPSPFPKPTSRKNRVRAESAPNVKSTRIVAEFQLEN